MMKSYVTALLALMLVSTGILKAEPLRRQCYYRTSLGLRLGWIGGPNGLTVRRVVGQASAFEFVAGYNGKYGRRADIPELKKGNSFIGASYAPFLLMSDGNIGVALVADMGFRLNYHHYRYIGAGNPGGKITPEVIGGLGMQIEFSEVVEVFGDIHLKYFNEPQGSYTAGMESGLGIRFAL